MTNKEILTRVGIALYGKRWQTQLAKDFDVNVRTMRRWISGDSSLPWGIDRQLQRLIDERSKALGDVKAEIDKGEVDCGIIGFDLGAPEGDFSAMRCVCETTIRWRKQIPVECQTCLMQIEIVKD